MPQQRPLPPFPVAGIHDLEASRHSQGASVSWADAVCLAEGPGWLCADEMSHTASTLMSWLKTKRSPREAWLDVDDDSPFNGLTFERSEDVDNRYRESKKGLCGQQLEWLMLTLTTQGPGKGNTPGKHQEHTDGGFSGHVFCKTETLSIDRTCAS